MEKIALVPLWDNMFYYYSHDFYLILLSRHITSACIDQDSKWAANHRWTERGTQSIKGPTFPLTPLWATSAELIPINVKWAEEPSCEVITLVSTDCRQRRPTCTAEPETRLRPRVATWGRQRTQLSNPPTRSPSWLTDQMSEPQHTQRQPTSSVPPKSTAPIGWNPSPSTPNRDVTWSYINSETPETYASGLDLHNDQWTPRQ